MSKNYLHSEAGDKIPAELKNCAQWITWDAGAPDQKGKFDKFPKGRDGTGNAWQTQNQWSTFDEALRKAKLNNHSGVGIVLPAQLANGSYLVALDFDDVDLNDQPSNLRLQEIKALHKSLGSPYIEASPSGRGLRMFVRSHNSLPQVTCMNPHGGKDELFCASGKWTTVTGFGLGGSGVPEATDEIQMVAQFWQANAIKNQTSQKKLKHINSTTDCTHLVNGWVGWPEQRIKDGDGRELMMLVFAGHLRGKGFDQITIERLCLEANQNHYEDKLDDGVVLDRARRYEIGDETSSENTQNGEMSTGNDFGLLEKVDHTDAGNVAVLHNLIDNKMRYLYELNKWIVWNGKRWNIDSGNGQVHQWLLKVSEHHKKHGDKLLKLADTAGTPEQAKDFRNASKKSYAWAIQCSNKNRLDAMTGLAQRDKRFMLESNLLDKDPWLFGVGNGVVNLQDGLLRPDSKDEFVLKRSMVNYKPNATCPKWENFINEITSVPDGKVNGRVRAKLRPHLSAYLQKALGYSLTGRVNEHVMFIANGRGSNGKNVTLDTYKAILGEYCETIPPEVLMASKNERGAEQATPSLRKLAGVRCAISSESKDGQRLDIAVIKRHTGGGYMNARGMYENLITFEITHKLWLMTNPKPRLDQLDEATKGRLHLIPFDMKWNRPGEVNPDPSLPDADKDLMDALKTEYEGILVWLVAGAVKYHLEGLKAPTEVAAFTRDYLASQDLLTRWLNERIESCPVTEGSLATDLLISYQDFCKSEDELTEFTKATDLSRRLKSLGYEFKKTRDGNRYGMKIATPQDDTDTKDYANLSEEEIEEMLADDFYEGQKIERAGGCDDAVM